MLEESQTMSGVRAPSSSNSSVDLRGVSISSNSNAMSNVFPFPSKIKCGDNSDPTTPLDGHTFSVFSESTPPLGTSPWDESSSAQSPIGKIMKSEEPNEEFISPGSCEKILDFTSDLLPDIDWNEQIDDMEKEQSNLDDTLASMEKEQSHLDDALASIFPGDLAPSNQTWEVDSFPWSNISGVC